ncbi:hypothetical protein ACTFIW_002166 [Dictyostelium discoideum]
MVKIKNIIILFCIFGLLSNVSSLSSSSSSSQSSDNNGNLSPIQDYDLEFLSKHLTTKTPYWILTKNGDSNSQGDSSSGSSSGNGGSNSDSSNEPPEQCKLISIDFLARHGSRMPVLNSIEKLKEMTTSILEYKEQVNQGFKWIFNYSVPYPSDIAGNLILQGQYEHYNISKRLLKKYPQFFEPMKYKPQSYSITSTAISRTGISASAFSYGLLQGTGSLGVNGFQPVFIETASLDQDILLRFFATCNQYVDQLKNGTLINKDEQTKWNQMVFPNISNEISERLGLSDIWLPTSNVISDIFEACAYEISINNISDHWCSLLSKQNILDWEYSQDLSNYWLKSYGHEINYQIASPLLNDILSGFDIYINNNSGSSNNGDSSNSNSNSNGNSGSSSGSGSSTSTSSNDNSGSTNNDNDKVEPTSILRFGHAETIIPFISLLGLYKDEQKLFANSSTEQIENRKFRTSVVSPYASNIAMFLFDCGSSDGFKILVQHNELPVLVPGCDEIYCDYQQFKSIFKQGIDNFKWNSYCNINNNDGSGGSSSSDSGNGNSTDSHSKKSSYFLAIFIPITFLVGGTIGGIFTYFSYEKIMQFKNRKKLTQYGNDEFISSPKSKSFSFKSTKFDSRSPLIQ